MKKVDNEKRPATGGTAEHQPLAQGAGGGDDPRAHDHRDRGHWNKPIEFLLTCVGIAVGLGNVWRFPYLCYKNGGGAFLIPYFIFLLIAGLPALYLELLIGQFPSLGPNMVFRHLAPVFTGVGWGMVSIAFLTAIYYNMVITWSILYLGLSFADLSGGTVKWATCRGQWNTNLCYSELENDNCGQDRFFYQKQCHNKTSEPTLYLEFQQYFNASSNLNFRTPGEEFFNGFIYDLYKIDSEQTTDTLNMSALGGVRWHLLVALIVSWLLCFACLFKGVQSIGKVVYFTATFPYVVMTILLIRGITLEGAGEGIEFYMKPDLSRLGDAGMWKDAASQIFFSLDAGFGDMLTMASYNRFTHNCYRDALLVVVINCSTSIYAGFAIFSTIGYLAKTMNKPVPSVMTSGVSLAFMVYPEAISRMPYPPFWAIVFFFMLVTLGIDSEFALIEALVSSIIDAYPRMRNHKLKVVAVMCSVLGILGIPFTMGGGYYIYLVFDAYSCYYGLMLIALFEIIVPIYVYGLKRFTLDIEMMLGKRDGLFWQIFGPSGWYWRIMWLVGAPLLLTSGLFVYIYDHEPLTTDSGYKYPILAEVIGWLMALWPAFCIIGFSFYMTGKYKKKKIPLGDLVKPTIEWCPCDQRVTETAIEFERNGTKEKTDKGQNAKSSIKQR